MKKAIAKKRITHATFMYIPERASSVKSLRIPLWFPKVVMLSITALIVFSVVCVYILNGLNLQYQASKDDISKLTDINNTQKTEIERLQQDAEEIQKQLEENSKVLDELKKAVGIEEDTDSEETENEEASAAGNTSSLNVSNLIEEAQMHTTIISTNYADMTNSLNQMQSAFISLSSQAKNQKEYIEDSVSTIHKQIAYNRAIPSILPVVGRVTAGFGYRKNPFTSRGSEFHAGIDFGAPTGTNVVATADGSVIFAGWHSGYGRMVIISHGNGITTLYAHNSKLLVKQGDKVEKGQLISKVGSTGRSTGPHLHYEVKINGKSVNPEKYLK